jgi:hypothetical protein
MAADRVTGGSHLLGDFGVPHRVLANLQTPSTSLLRVQYRGDRQTLNLPARVECLLLVLHD